METEKILFNKHSLLGLLIYLHQLDLSIDRCRWTTWDCLKEFYADKYHPSEVLDWCIAKIPDKQQLIYHKTMTYKISFDNRLMSLFYRLCFNGNCLGR